MKLNGNFKKGNSWHCLPLPLLLPLKSPVCTVSSCYIRLSAAGILKKRENLVVMQLTSYLQSLLREIFITYGHWAQKVVQMAVEWPLGTTRFCQCSAAPQPPKRDKLLLWRKICFIKRYLDPSGLCSNSQSWCWTSSGRLQQHKFPTGAIEEKKAGSSQCKTACCLIHKCFPFSKTVIGD